MKKLLAALFFLAAPAAAYDGVSIVFSVPLTVTTNGAGLPVVIDGVASGVDFTVTTNGAGLPTVIDGVANGVIFTVTFNGGPQPVTVENPLNVTVQGSVTVIQGTDPWVTSGTIWSDVRLDVNNDGTPDVLFSATPTGGSPAGNAIFAVDFFGRYNLSPTMQYGVFATNLNDTIKPSNVTTYGHKILGSIGLGLINGGTPASAVYSRLSATAFTASDHLGTESGTALHTKVIGTALTAATIQGSVTVTGQVDVLPPSTGTTVFGDSYVRVNSNNAGLMTLVSGTNFEDPDGAGGTGGKQAMHTIPVGPDTSASSYTIAVAATPVDLFPGFLENINHVEIFNNGSETLYLGGSDVATTSGIPLPANSGRIYDNVSGGLTMYGIISSTTPVDCRIQRF